MPFSGNGGSRSFDIEGREVRAGPKITLKSSCGLSATAILPRCRSRSAPAEEFTTRDTLGAPRVAVINEAFAHKHLSGRLGDWRPNHIQQLRASLGTRSWASSATSNIGRSTPAIGRELYVPYSNHCSITGRSGRFTSSSGR